MDDLPFHHVIFLLCIKVDSLSLYFAYIAGCDYYLFYYLSIHILALSN